MLLWVAQNFFGVSGYPYELIAVGVFTMFFIWGWLGLIWVRCKEFPLFFFRVQGLGAIIIGLIFTIASWGLALYLVSDLVLIVLGFQAGP
jgi:hypothetical protein